MKIYITYCSNKKDDSLKLSHKEVTPDLLYTSRKRIQPFMRTCKLKGVRWAIFSDLYGVWSSEEKHAWYEKSPISVTESEFACLLEDFDNKLAEFDEILFYRPSPVYFHSLYRRLLEESKLRDRVRFFSRISQIE